TRVESIEKSVQSYKDIDAWNETPVLKEESFDKLQLIMTEAGELTQKAPYNKIVNNTYAEKVIK
ncbi:MAG: ABC transporter substrate-binding protein, partial [Clostridia bacterium]